MPSRGDEMEGRRTGSRGVSAAMARALLFVLAFVAVMVALPSIALADGYEMTKVSIDATVNPDGSMDVVEDRTFEFYDSFHGVYWLVPKGYNPSNGKEVSLSDVVGGVMAPDGFQRFSENGSEDSGTVQLTDEGSLERLKIYYTVYDGDVVTYRIAYHVDGILTRWEDTAELYWKFVSDGWDAESQDVTCTVHLPVPAGETVDAGGNVRAWGHGPLDASVTFDGNDVVYQCPGVGGSEYAEARVTFPAEWLAGCEVTDGSELQTILSEEQQWADEANARRERARMALGGSVVGAYVLSVISLLRAILGWRRYKATHTPQFDDKYFRDVPTADHPAVLARLVGDGDAEKNGMTAALMRLTDLRVASLDKITYVPKRRKREREAYVMRQTGALPAAGGGEDAASAHEVDQATVDFFFGWLGPRMRGRSAPEADEPPSVNFSEIESYAKDHARRYSQEYGEWSSEVAAQCTIRFEGDGAKDRAGTVVLGVLAFVAAMVLFFYWLIAGFFSWWAVAGVTLLVGSGVVCIVASSKMRDLNPEGVEVLAKTEALKRWLCDFTRLEEAVPTDVVLWNRLLVMATALGVADKVIEQLKVALPQVVDDPGFMPTYGWYYYGMGSRLGNPATAVGDAVAQAHSVSAAAVASSSSSSGSGGGGGFSGGGGGGFGGGGGGGAF